MKKRILLVTGRNAKSDVEDYTKNFPVRIHVCKENVAALLSPRGIIGELSRENLDGISIIIVPGAMWGDVSEIREKLDIPVWRGPRSLADLPFVLERVLSGMELSPEVPADELLENEIRKRIEMELDKVYRPKEYSMKIGDSVFLGSGISHVIAEIPFAPLTDKRSIGFMADYYEKAGAEVIDIGMVTGEDNSKRIKDIVDVIRNSTKLPIAIDSLREKEILAAVDVGVDLVLSLDLTNSGVSDSIDVPVVIIPRDEKGNIPKNVDDRIKIIERLVGKVENFIADPVLEPPNLGLVESLKGYMEFRGRYPDVPMLMGAGNVTELMDADSPGINALLASIASELEIDLLFTTEASKKTHGCVRELSIAAKMAYLAKVRKQAPKDLGMDLLVLKEKREVPAIAVPSGIPTIDVKERREPALDNVEFRIFVDNEGMEIGVIYYKNKKPELRFTGKHADRIYGEIIGRGILKNPEHAAYLGKELAKAEIALELGRNYIQDEHLF